MKFEAWKGITSQSSYIKSRPDLVKGKLGRGVPKILENA